MSRRLAALSERLHPVSETASLDAQLLLAQVLGVNRAWVLAHPEFDLNSEQLATLESLAVRLESGEPLPYLLGHWEFYGLDFIVSPAVLIPRPETELLVEQALQWLRARPRSGPEGENPSQVIDVGCGSGCVAVALATNTPGLKVTAVDLSPAAIEIALQNVARHGLSERVSVWQADLLEPGPVSHPAGAAEQLPVFPTQAGEQPAMFDLICANLPYIRSEHLAGLSVARWEPRLALDGGPDGLALIRRLLQQATGRLAPGGMLLMEIESSQGVEASQLARQAFPHTRVEVLMDLSGLDRLVRVEKSS